MDNVKLYGSAEINAYPSGDGEIDIEFHSGNGDFTAATINMNYNHHSQCLEVDCIDIHFHEDKDGNEMPFEDINFDGAIDHLIAEHQLIKRFQEAVDNETHKLL